MPLSQSLANHDRQFDQLERLCQVVECTLLYGVHSRFNRAVAGDNNADDFWISNQRLFEKLDARLLGKIVIGDQNVVSGLR